MPDTLSDFNDTAAICERLGRDSGQLLASVCADRAPTKSAATAVGLYPGLGKMQVIRAWAGIEAFAQDEEQILGPVSGLEGLVLAAGFSGHGFAIGPGVGKLLAEFILQDQLSGLLAPFTLDRFNPAKKDS